MDIIKYSVLNPSRQNYNNCKTMYFVSIEISKYSNLFFRNSDLIMWLEGCIDLKQIKICFKIIICVKLKSLY